MCMKVEERMGLLAMPHKMVRSSEALDQGLGQSCFQLSVQKQLVLTTVDVQ